MSDATHKGLLDDSERFTDVEHLSQLNARRIAQLAADVARLRTLVHDIDKQRDRAERLKRDAEDAASSFRLMAERPLRYFATIDCWCADYEPGQKCESCQAEAVVNRFYDGSAR